MEVKIAKNGYMGKLLFVDLSRRQIWEEPLSEEVARKFIGGWGIGAKVIWERSKAGIDPLGPENIFGMGTGPFVLTGIPSTCRYHTMGKSPLTGYWGGANSGGSFAYALKSTGYDLIRFHGESRRSSLLLAYR